MFSTRNMILVFLIFIGESTRLAAQRNYDHRNGLKFNAVGLVTGLYSAQYERGLGDNLSFVATGFFRQKSIIPFSEPIDNFMKKNGLLGINFEYIFMNEAQVGVKGISPELRYYIGDKKHRMFVSLFGQLEDLDMTVPASLPAAYQGTELNIIAPIDFAIRTISGGILLGKQFRFGRVGVDFVLIGPHLGNATKVDATIKSQLLAGLNPEDRELTKQKVIERFNIDEKYFLTSLGETQGDINAKRKVPYAGIRGFGVNLAYYF